VKRLFATFALAALVGCSSGEKKEGEKPKTPKRPVAEAEVPKPILDSWAKNYPGAKATGWTERGGNYAVMGQASNGWVEVKFVSDGSVKEAASEIAADGAPDPVKSAFASSSYSKLTFIDGEKRDAPGNKDYPTLYKFILKDGAKPVIAVYKPDGSFVKEKTMPAEKLEKWRAEHTIAK
jgi:hypothetical protein